MKFVKKCLLFVFAIFISVSLTGCFNFGGSTGGNNMPSNPSTPSNPSFDPNFDPTSTASQPQVNAIAGIYLPENESELSEANITARNNVYSGVITAAASAFPLISAPTSGTTETDAEQKSRVINNAKHNLIESTAKSYLVTTNQAIEQFKIGLFESEIDALIAEIGTKSTSVSYTENGTTKTETVTFSVADKTSIKNKIVEYLSKSANVPGGSRVEGGTTAVLVAPMVEAQIFKVETYQIKQDMGGGIEVPIDIKYLDDGNGYSTRDFGDDDFSDKMVLPQKKWLSLSFNVQATSSNKVFMLGFNSYIVHTMQNNDGNVIDLIEKQKLKNYSTVLTGKSQNSTIELNSSTYKSNISDFTLLDVQNDIDRMKEENPDFELSDEERENMEEKYEKLNSRFMGQFEVEINCIDESKEAGSRAPIFGSVSFEEIINNGTYRNQYFYKKSGTSEKPIYSVQISSVTIDNSIFVHFVSDETNRIAFSMEGVDLGVADRDKFDSDSIISGIGV